MSGGGFVAAGLDLYAGLVVAAPDITDVFTQVITDGRIIRGHEVIHKTDFNLSDIFLCNQRFATLQRF